MVCFKQACRLVHGTDEDFSISYFLSIRRNSVLLTIPTNHSVRSSSETLCAAATVPQTYSDLHAEMYSNTKNVSRPADTIFMFSSSPSWSKPSARACDCLMAVCCSSAGSRIPPHSVSQWMFQTLAPVKLFQISFNVFCVHSQNKQFHVKNCNDSRIDRMCASQEQVFKRGGSPSTSLMQKLVNNQIRLTVCAKRSPTNARLRQPWIVSQSSLLDIPERVHTAQALKPSVFTHWLLLRCQYFSHKMNFVHVENSPSPCFCNHLSKHFLCNRLQYSCVSVFHTHRCSLSNNQIL